LISTCFVPYVRWTRRCPEEDKTLVFWRYRCDGVMDLLPIRRGLYKPISMSQTVRYGTTAATVTVSRNLEDVISTWWLTQVQHCLVMTNCCLMATHIEKLRNCWSLTVYT